MSDTATARTEGAPPRSGEPPPERSRRAGIPEVRLARSATNRVFTGVAGGIGERLGVDPLFVRSAFVVLALAGGTGVLLYLLAWALAGPPRTDDAAVRPPSAQQALPFAMVVLGLLLVLRDLGIWFGDALVWPLALTVTGYTFIWAHNEADGRPRWRWLSRVPDPLAAIFGGRASWLRIGLGGLLVMCGFALLLALSEAVQRAGLLLVGAVVFTMLGTALVLGPAVLRLVRQLGEERSERIRSAERAEMAAHLHDSVLQTLALIQRSGDPRDMATLARGQERELRAWLSGKAENETELLSTALEDLAALVEQRHRVKVEVVVVGDEPLTTRTRAMVRAAGEAMANAAAHSGATVVSVYVEATRGEVNVYVTDEGKGFEPETVSPDRRGIAESIIGRMERHGGRATVTSEPGEGTEVHLQMTRNGS